MEKKKLVFYVNGYGVPRNIFADAGYVQYVRTVLAWAETSDASVTVHFAGGATDPAQPDKTEAGEMRRLAEELLRPERRERVVFQVITEATDLIGNLRAFNRRLTKEDDLTVFCEYARQDRVRFLVWRLFPGAKVVPITFDREKGGRIKDRLREFPNSVLIAAGFLSPAFKRWVTDPLRARHMRRDSARRHARPST